MGCSVCYRIISEKVPVTSKELKTLLSASLYKCNILRKELIEQINKKEDEIIDIIKQKKIELAFNILDDIIIDKDFVEVYNILEPIIEEMKEKSPYIILNIECPNDIRASLDTLIYSSTRVEIEELIQFREKIKFKYGSTYIYKADYNTDKYVNKDILNKFKGTFLTEEMKKIKIEELCTKKGIKITIEGDKPSLNSNENKNPDINEDNEINVNKILGDTVMTQVHKSNNNDINNNNQQDNNGQSNGDMIKLLENKTILNTENSTNDHGSTPQQKKDNNHMVGESNNQTNKLEEDNINNSQININKKSNLLRIRTSKTLIIDENNPQLNKGDNNEILLRLAKNKTLNIDNEDNIPQQVPNENQNKLEDANNQAMRLSVSNPYNMINPYERNPFEEDSINTVEIDKNKSDDKNQDQDQDKDKDIFDPKIIIKDPFDVGLISSDDEKDNKNKSIKESEIK